MNKNSVAAWAIYAVIVIAIVALLYVAVTAFGLPIPGWFLHALGIVVIAFVIIALIRLLVWGGGPPPTA